MAKVNKTKKTSNRIYNIWSLMKKRCFNKKDPAYNRYGGRGITVYNKWLNFEGFYEDMAGMYRDNLTLDRINNEGDYTKENCRWTSYKEQNRNKRNNTLIKGKTLSEWSEVLGVNRSRLAQRYYVYGWSVDQTLKV